MSETVAAAVDEPDAALVTEIVYNKTNREKKWKFCNNVTLPRSEVVFVAQMVVTLILITFGSLKLCVTKLSCKETSV